MNYRNMIIYTVQETIDLIIKQKIIWVELFPNLEIKTQFYHIFHPNKKFLISGKYQCPVVEINKL